MRVLIVILLLTLVVSLALVGCVDSNDSTSTPNENASVTPTSDVTNIASPEPTAEITETPAPTPEPTETIPQKAELPLASGQTFSYRMSTDAGEYGNSQYEVTAEEMQADATVYTIQATLAMAASCPTTPTTGTAVLQIDQYGMLESYTGQFSVGQG